MDSPRRGGFSFLLTIAIAAIVGILAYSAGVSAGHTTTAGAAGAVVVYGGPGFGFFGFFLVFLLFILIVSAMARAFGRARYNAWGRGWQGGGHGGWQGGGHRDWHGGPGGWQTGSDDAAKAGPPPFIEDWHRRMHEQPGAPKDTPKDAPADKTGA
ncbi:MAG: hypothetical protein ACHQ15_06560 [Candidatus Limnocylindrales bacterium]